MARQAGVAVVEGLDEDDLVARIQQAQQRGRDGLGGAAGDEHLGERIVGGAVQAGLALGQRRDQLGVAHGPRVLVVALTQGAHHRVYDLRRTIEVREALGEVDGAVLLGQAGHLAEDGGAKRPELLAGKGAHGRALSEPGVDVNGRRAPPERARVRRQ
jgi:hypothetical protein